MQEHVELLVRASRNIGVDAVLRGADAPAAAQERKAVQVLEACARFMSSARQRRPALARTAGGTDRMHGVLVSTSSGCLPSSVTPVQERVPERKPRASGACTTVQAPLHASWPHHMHQSDP